MPHDRKEFLFYSLQNHGPQSCEQNGVITTLCHSLRWPVYNNRRSHQMVFKGNHFIIFSSACMEAPTSLCASSPANLGKKLVVKFFNSVTGSREPTPNEDASPSCVKLRVCLLEE